MRVLHITSDGAEQNGERVATAAGAWLKDIAPDESISVETPPTGVALIAFLSRADSYDCVVVEFPDATAASFKEQILWPKFVEGLQTTKVPLLALCGDGMNDEVKSLLGRRRNALTASANHLAGVLSIRTMSCLIGVYRQEREAATCPGKRGGRNKGLTVLSFGGGS